YKVAKLLQNGYLWNSSGLGEYFFRLYNRDVFFKEYEEVRKKYITHAQSFFEELSKIVQIKVYPSMANFALIELLDGSTSSNFVSKMLIKYGVYTRTCSDKIGLNGEFIRIAARSQKENEIIVKAIKEIFKNNEE
ncbi:aminotransferase class I/II-fold pyridoxal phosphate-dependent enzyme, partial [Campylobacter concisus]